MILCIADVLSLVELNEIIELLSQADFMDGKITAGWNAKLVKNNMQLPKGSSQGQRVQEIITAALARSSLFQLAARPKVIHPILVSRYQRGMFYGIHTDDGLMVTQQQVMRSDIAFTLFLSNPEDYEGGELTIESSEGERAYKLPAGAMVLYPASTLHRVASVTHGIRLAAVSWVQSLVRDPQEREILFDLETVRQQLFQKSGKTRQFDLLSKTYANLLRKWADI
ncbi:Fe2+-dependent dioxygenase [Synechococcus sp. Nb3U1]|uniref:Fe2+-dependent dioxygenase n=1 Tax=Synechococcus sp. Nb3U1 TaxID=1914529 RepID=UPI001F23CBED|nr:Fe2+-dependent dioxygenase [Synechococcus sp. Nb3U1]MCF2970365.1 Fe2+-dependent dioxygenase [Synechococcus sp. Nb3U1]